MINTKWRAKEKEQRLYDEETDGTRQTYAVVNMQN